MGLGVGLGLGLGGRLALSSLSPGRCPSPTLALITLQGLQAKAMAEIERLRAELAEAEAALAAARTDEP